MIHNFDTKLFKWSFKSYYKEHRCWCELEGNDVIINIIHKLEDYSTQTWSAVKSASGYMRDFEQVFSLRLTGKKRLIGYVLSGTFYPLWYDKDHLIFPC